MKFDAYLAATRRRSVRSYDGKPLSEEHRALIVKFIEELKNPFGTKTEFVFLNAAEHSLSSPVLTGETEFVAIKTPKAENFEAGYGFAAESLILYLWSLGIGSVWIGGTMNRASFERAAKLQPNELMPCMTPIGYAAKHMSVREALMRKGVKADARKPFEELAFNESFAAPLDVNGTGSLRASFEMLRRAPSAVNKQPWRVVKQGDVFHFYEKRDKGYIKPETGDLQRIDVGIALCHFWLGAQANGLAPSLILREPDIAKPEDVVYVASVRI